MNDVIQYVKESRELMRKQGCEIQRLHDLLKQAASAISDIKSESESFLDDVGTKLASTGQFTPESVANALIEKNAELLTRAPIVDKDVNDWGELDNKVSVEIDNLRPSERKLYERFGLI